MPIAKRHLGRRYGPYQFTVGVEHVRDFVAAVGGGVPGQAFPAAPASYHPLTWDPEAAARIIEVVEAMLRCSLRRYCVNRVVELIGIEPMTSTMPL